MSIFTLREVDTGASNITFYVLYRNDTSDYQKFYDKKYLKHIQEFEYISRLIEKISKGEPVPDNTNVFLSDVSGIYQTWRLKRKGRKNTVRIFYFKFTEDKYVLYFAGFRKNLDNLKKTMKEKMKLIKKEGIDYE